MSQMLVTRSAPAPRGLKQFFRATFSFIRSTTFSAFAGGTNSVAPVNAVQSYGGITVTPELAMTLSSAWACIWRYANTVSTLPLHVLQVGPQNTAKRAPDHPLYAVLHDRPNANMSASAFWQMMVASMLLWGACYARRFMVGTRTVSLVPLLPQHMIVYWKDNGLWYRYQPPQPTEQFDLPASELFVVLDRTLDGYTGLSRIEYARNSLGLGISADQVSNNFYRNGLRASGILYIEKWLKPEQREAYRTLLAQFMGTGTGASTDKQGGVLVAENATKFEALTMKPQDVELLASRRFTVEDVCRWFDVPPVLVGHAAEGQTMWGTGIEQLILGWQKLGLAPVVKRIEQEIWRQLLSPADRRTYFAEFNLDALLRGDSAARATMYSTMVQNGIYTRNEIRAWENLPPAPGGDMLTAQTNLVPLDKLGKRPPATTPAPPGTAEDDVEEPA